ncbi:MAG: ABC transporter permease [Eubacteriales bacterium]|nr:ABC transporter permease [Eubacteriales bacterium]
MVNEQYITDDLFQRERDTEAADIYIKHSLLRDIKKEFWNNKPALICVFLLAIVVVAALLAPLSPYEPNAINAMQRLKPMSAEHWFGTDEFGRDYFTRILYGGRVSLAVGFASMIVTVIIGTAIGILSGYIGGKLDMMLMRFTDIFLALPSTLLMVVLNTLLQPGLITLVCVLSLFSWASVARITRAETIALKERDFVVASKNLGTGNLKIALVHIVPNILGPITVAASLGVANAILTESSLSFLGLGVQVPQASWGSMLQTAQGNMMNNPLLAIFPGACILITVLSFNLIGDVLRSALEPKIVK